MMKSELKLAIETAEALRRRDPMLKEQWELWRQSLRVIANADHAGIVNGAYKTMCMTLKGYRSWCCEETKKKLDRRFAAALKTKLKELRWHNQCLKPEAFNCWHASVCEALIEIWDQHFSLTWGQAQAWVNNVLMLCAAVNRHSRRFVSLHNYLHLLHVPLNCKIYRLMELGWDVAYDGVPVHAWFFNWQLPAWSVLDDQEAYMEIQELWRAIAADHHLTPCQIAVAACWLKSQE